MIEHKEECTFAVCGPVDAGKSSLIGVLTSGELDDGRGFAREKILKHQHELESGRTSNITFNPIIYKKNNDGTFLYSVKEGMKKLLKISDHNSESNFEKIISFIDLAGHEKYFKTTVYGVTGLFPDYGLVVIAANTGITKLTREHIGILFYLKIPFMICITKIDLAPSHVYHQLCNRLKNLLSRNNYNKIVYFIVVIAANTGITKLTREHIGILFYLKIPFMICITKIDLAPSHVYHQLCNRLKNLLSRNNYNKIVYFISDSQSKYEETNIYIDKMINNTEIIPIISISNKEGINIDNLHLILSNIPNRKRWNKDEVGGSIVYLDSNFQVPGIGLVLSGMVKGKEIAVKDKLFLGPMNGIFYPVSVRSIHNSIREIVKEAKDQGQFCFAIKFLNQKNYLERNQIKKGMVLIDDINRWKDNIVLKFKAKITILLHSTTIKTGYTPLIHCGPIRQSASIKLLDESLLRSGDNCIVEFTFQYHSEFLEKGMTFFFRDGNTKGVGEVLSLN